MTTVEDQPDGIDPDKEGDDSVNDPDDLIKVQDEDELEDVEDHDDDENE